MSSSKKNIVILGSTGSIGTSTLKVIESHPNKFCVYALVANTNVHEILKQIQIYQPKYTILINKKSAQELYLLIKENKNNHLLQNTIILTDGINDMLDVIKHPQVDIVMSSIVGVAGLEGTLSAIKAGKKVLIANKESLVTASHLCFDAAKKSQAQIIPVDSEHNAMFQSLPLEVQNNIGFCNITNYGVQSLILTGSGGPFRERDLNTFDSIKLNEALKHPNWQMGAKISIDSATMMNKGLEFIEAVRLFNCNTDQVEVVIHPQSFIHSMVRYCDGSLISQSGPTTMQVAIAYAIGYPERIVLKEQTNLLNIGNLTFSEICKKRYPCFFLAKDACNSGIIATNKLNSANEFAVEMFLKNKIKFTDIYKLISWVLEQNIYSSLDSIEEILAFDHEIKLISKQWVDRYA